MTNMLGPLVTFYTPAVACLVLALVYPTYVPCTFTYIYLLHITHHQHALHRIKSVQTIEHPEPQAIAQWLTYWYVLHVGATTLHTLCQYRQTHV